MHEYTFHKNCTTRLMCTALLYYDENNKTLFQILLSLIVERKIGNVII